MDARELARGRARVIRMEDEAHHRLATDLHEATEAALERIHRYTPTEHQMAAECKIVTEHIAMMRYRANRRSALAAKERAKVEAQVDAEREAVLRPYRAAGAQLRQFVESVNAVLSAFSAGFHGGR